MIANHYNQRMKKMGNFIARISDAFEKDGEAHVVITGMTSKGEKLPDIVIPESEFESMNWLLPNWGSKVKISNFDLKKSDLAGCIIMASRADSGIMLITRENGQEGYIKA